MYTKISVFCALLIHSAAAFSADISLVKLTNESKFNSIRINGTIFPGDANKVKTLVAKSNSLGILINSRGGDVLEAIKIANIVEQYRQPVTVAGSGFCVSACFFIYIAGNGKAATPIDETARDMFLMYGTVGIHRPFLKIPDGKTSSQSSQTKIMRQVTSYLENQMVPRRIIDLMMSRPSNDIYWLTSEDIYELGNYPPALEELYITKCGYDRKLLKYPPDNTLVEPPNADGSYNLTATGEAYFAKTTSIQDCIFKINGWK